MFGGRTDTSIQAGDQVPGIQVVMYIQNTREHRVAHETLRTRAMDELINDLDKVLTDECQPLSGFKTQTIPGQPRRLSPKTPGGVGTGISVKFWLIAPTHPQDIASIAGILLPTPILFPLKIAEDTASPLAGPCFAGPGGGPPQRPRSPWPPRLQSKYHTTIPPPPPSHPCMQSGACTAGVNPFFSRPYLWTDVS
jgi:hypothetical protein